MIEVFEQYLKVATLKEKADRMEQEDEDGNKDPFDGTQGGGVPDIGSAADQEITESANRKLNKDD